MRFPLVLLALGVSAVSAFGSTFVVANTNDSGYGSLRQAILDANGTPNDPSAPDFIQFQIAGSGVHTITLASALPEITDPVMIIGLWDSVTRHPTIELTAQAGLTIDGLVITGGNTTVERMVLNGFRRAISMSQNGNNLIKGCYIGTDPTGTFAVPNDTGIYSDTTSGNRIGHFDHQWTEESDRNVISGNRYSAINLTEIEFYYGTKTRGNVIENNYIGTDSNGRKAIQTAQRFLRVVTRLVPWT